jgi:AmiR/NasT family two-component response regulator
MNTYAADISATNFQLARGRLGARRIVVKAIIHLIGFDDDDAYQHLRKESMRKRISVEELSTRLVACGQGRHRI